MCLQRAEAMAELRTAVSYGQTRSATPTRSSQAVLMPMDRTGRNAEGAGVVGGWWECRASRGKVGRGA